MSCVSAVGKKASYLWAKEGTRARWGASSEVQGMLFSNTKQNTSLVETTQRHCCKSLSVPLYVFGLGTLLLFETTNNSVIFKIITTSNA